MWNKLERELNDDKCQLELFECSCGFHIGIDTTYLDQVNDTPVVECPSCDTKAHLPVVANEKLSTFTAVFNCHINDAKERAIDVCKNSMGVTNFDNEIQPLLDNGLMSIFSTDPTERTLLFIQTITDFVNEDRV